MRHLLVLILCLFISAPSFSQTTIYVAPGDTDGNYDPGDDDHAITYKSSGHLDKLLLMMNGTWSQPTGNEAFREYAANRGWDVISISYPNNVPAAGLAEDPDSLAMDKLRQEICYGTPVSPDVDVDTLNSITTRLLKLLIYLDANNSARDWGQYLDGGAVDWSKVGVAGHSQGAGHAAYLAKFEEVERVIMFSGPNDYSTYHSQSAPWVRAAGVTDVDRHFSYLSLNDEVVDYSKQYAVMDGLGMLVSDDSTYVDNQGLPFENSHCLYTTQSPGLVILNHGVPVKNTIKNRTVWYYMLTTSVSKRALSPAPEEATDLYPNPTSGLSSLEIPGPALDIAVHDHSGRLIIHRTAPGPGIFQLDLSGLPTGIYLIRNGPRTVRVMKQ